MITIKRVTTATLTALLIAAGATVTSSHGGNPTHSLRALKMAPANQVAKQALLAESAGVKSKTAQIST